MNSALAVGPRTWSVGTLPGNQQACKVSEEHLSRHMGIFGGSGSGKSKLLELLCRKMIEDYRGFCFIDPHGDTSEDILAFVQKRTETLRTDAPCKRIHYLEPTFETVFGFDPFKFELPAGVSARENAYHAWLHAKADKIAEIVQRKQGQADFQGMARLQRILRDVLIAVGTAVTPDGTHLALSDVLVLLDSHNPRHRYVLDTVTPHLPPEVRADFASLASYRTEEQRKKETESTINRLRSLLSPIVKAIFTSTSKTIDFRSIIANRGIVLVNIRKTDFFSADQRNAIGGLIIHELLSTIETIPREDRVPYYLIVDEARLFIGEDLMEALDQARKFKLSVILAGQHLGQFRTEEYDMTPSILNNCGSIVCFQQKHPEDLKIWKEYFGYSNVSFEKHFQVMDRPDGYDWVDIEERSESHSHGKSNDTGVSFNRNEGESHSVSSTESEQRGRNWSQGSQSGITMTQGRAVSETSSTGYTNGQSPLVHDGKLRSIIGTEGANRGHSQSVQRSESESESYSTSRSEGGSQTYGKSNGRTDGVSSSRGTGMSFRQGESESHGETVSYRKVPLARSREELHETPYLKNSVDDQFHKFAALQRRLETRHALVSLAGYPESFILRVGDVHPVYGAEFPEKVRVMKEKLFLTHDYYSRPDLTPEAQDKRLDEFLRAATGYIEEKPEETPFDA